MARMANKPSRRKKGRLDPVSTEETPNATPVASSTLPLPPAPQDLELSTDRPGYDDGAASTRSDANDFLLPGETSRDLKGPVWKGENDTPKKPEFRKLGGIKKEACDRAFDALDRRTAWAGADAEWLLASDDAFAAGLTCIIDEELRSLLKSPAGKGGNMYAGLKSLKKDLSTFDPRNLRMGFLSHLQCRNLEGTPEWDRAECARDVIAGVRTQRTDGKKVAKEGLWIGVERASSEHLSLMQGCVIFETDAQRLEAVRAKRITAEGSVALGGEYTRICCPTQPKNLSRPVAFIFWTKDSPDDNEPKWEKVFGGIIYNRDKELTAPPVPEEAAEVSLVKQLEGVSLEGGRACSDPVKANAHKVQFVRYRVAMDSVVRGTALNRSKKKADSGMMGTTVGSMSIYGQFTERDVVPSKSKKQEKMVEALRKDVKASMPVWQAYEHAFLKGFAPPIALAIERAAAKAPTTLFGATGAPCPAAFATFAYGAGAHVDRDDSPTIGRVLRRHPARVPRMEANFCFVSHKLVVELAQGAMWFWNATNDYHGTSVSSCALEKDVNWSKRASKDPDAAQWTLVSVFPIAVTNAAARKE